MKLEKCPKRVICTLWTFKIAIIISAAVSHELSKYTYVVCLCKRREIMHIILYILYTAISICWNTGKCHIWKGIKKNKKCQTKVNLLQIKKRCY